jgi:hypothetical protein
MCLIVRKFIIDTFVNLCMLISLTYMYLLIFFCLTNEEKKL